MNKMIRMCSFFIVIVFTVISLSSCHGKKVTSEEKPTIINTFNVPENFDESKQYNIVFWSKNDSNKEQLNIYNKAISDFEAIYPNIHIQMKSYYDYPSIYNDVLINIPTNTTPNVCISYPDHIAVYKEGNDIVLSLDNLITNEKYGLGGTDVKYNSVKKDEVVEKFLDEGKIKGTQYALPFVRSSEACYVNVDLVESLGFTLPEVLTWDFVWEVCSKAKEVYRNDSSFIPLIYKSTDNMAIQMARQYGIDYADEDGNILLFNDDMRSLLNQLWKYASPGNDKNRIFDTFARVSYPGNYYNKGKCIFAIDSTAGATWLGSKAPLIEIPASEVADFTTKVMEIPQKEASNKAMISQGPSLCLFNKEDSGEVLASWLFMQFLLTNDVQIAYSQTEGYVPVTSRALNDPGYLDYLSHEDDGTPKYYNVKIAASKLVIDNIDKTFITPVFNGSSSLRTAAGMLIESLFKPKYTNKSGDSSELNVNAIYNDAISLYKLNIGPEQTSKAPVFILAGVILSVWIVLGTIVIRKKLISKKAKQK